VVTLVTCGKEVACIPIARTGSSDVCGASLQPKRQDFLKSFGTCDSITELCFKFAEQYISQFSGEASFLW
jgi:hypothetical protein